MHGKKTLSKLLESVASLIFEKSNSESLLKVCGEGCCEEEPIVEGVSSVLKEPKIGPICAAGQQKIPGLWFRHSYLG